MEKIIILSPHRDDAAFSLGLALNFWSAASVELQVLNFFTQSAYAPYSSEKTIKEVSAIREKEDKRALAFIHNSIAVISLDLLDAPLRLSLPFGQITEERSSEKITQRELSHLSQLIQEHCQGGLAIAPLGLGNHVDHIAVHRAAINSLPPQTLAFYEDLPYATWTTPAELLARVESVEHTTRTPLKPFILQAQDAVRRKHQIASFYRSQITNEEADNIARHAERYSNGERFWTPAHSQNWKVIRSLATESPRMATPHPPK